MAGRQVPPQLARCDPEVVLEPRAEAGLWIVNPGLQLTAQSEGPIDDLVSVPGAGELLLGGIRHLRGRGDSS